MNSLFFISLIDCEQDFRRVEKKCCSFNNLILMKPIFQKFNIQNYET